jgi:hypothetical protein
MAGNFDFQMLNFGLGRPTAFKLPEYHSLLKKNQTAMESLVSSSHPALAQSPHNSRRRSNDQRHEKRLLARLADRPLNAKFTIRIPTALNRRI